MENSNFIRKFGGEKLWIIWGLFLICQFSTGFPQVFAQDINTLNCTFSEPVELTEGDYEYSQMVCDSEVFFQVAGETTTSTFLILRQFSYADILEIMLLIFILALLIFYILKQIILPQEVKTHSLPREEDF